MRYGLPARARLLDGLGRLGRGLSLLTLRGHSLCGCGGSCFCPRLLGHHPPPASRRRARGVRLGRGVVVGMVVGYGVVLSLVGTRGDGGPLGRNPDLRRDRYRGLSLLSRCRFRAFGGPVRLGGRQGEDRAGSRLLRGGALARGGQGPPTAPGRLRGGLRRGSAHRVRCRARCRGGLRPPRPVSRPLPRAAPGAARGARRSRAGPAVRRARACPAAAPYRPGRCPTPPFPRHARPP